VSQESVEIARAYYETLTRVLDAYERESGAIEDAPFVDDIFAYVAADAEWQSFFTAETFHGRDQWLRAAADWLDAVDPWHDAFIVRLEDHTDRDSAFAAAGLAQ
jgi:hypothetical protein